MKYHISECHVSGSLENFILQTVSFFTSIILYFQFSINPICGGVENKSRPKKRDTLQEGS